MIRSKPKQLENGAVPAANAYDMFVGPINSTCFKWFRLANASAVMFGTDNLNSSHSGN
jgi:hypothetical protein